MQPGWLYRLLLRLYPPDHRAEYGDLMATHARDLLRDARGGRTARIWRLLVADTLKSALRERIDTMKHRTNTLDALAGILLMPGALFLTLVLLNEYGGVTGGPLAGAYAVMGSAPWLNPAGIPLFVVAAGLAAALSGLSFGSRLRLHRGQPGMLAAAIADTSPLALTVVAASLLLLGIFTTYALAENWACLIGQMTTC
jgi:hypothetical protein